MDGLQIKEMINFNNQKIEEMLDPSTFVLKPEVQALLERNKELRALCPHSFKNGVCIYCGAEMESLK